MYKRQAYDFAYSSLKSLPKDDIFFVYGDNDTYPIWAIQETEEFRRDVKVVNFTLLGTPWNIDQVKRRTYDAMPVPSILNHDDNRDGTNAVSYTHLDVYKRQLKKLVMFMRKMKNLENTKL